LSTTNYALYILAYLHARSPSSSALLQRFLKLAGSQSSISRISASELEPPKPSPQSPAPFQRLGSLVSDTRTTLRLTALLPLYAWLRQLLGDTGSQDRYLRIISLIQCISYIVYQFTENVAFLTDHGIISRKWLGRRAGSGKWWLWSSRAWLAGVSCDLSNKNGEPHLHGPKKKRPMLIQSGSVRSTELGGMSCWLQAVGCLFLYITA
jgi:Peroxisomal biogenesis factor 11 (PEX11)